MALFIAINCLNLPFPLNEYTLVIGTLSRAHDSECSRLVILSSRSMTVAPLQPGACGGQTPPHLPSVMAPPCGLASLSHKLLTSTQNLIFQPLPYGFRLTSRS